MDPDSLTEKESEIATGLSDQADASLLRHWKAGNEQAAEIFFDRYAIRLVALVASRLNSRYRASIDPDEVVQSAMGSFFDAAKHSRIQVSGSVSLWRLLATFARRKMARSIERHSAVKRGGDLQQVTLSEAESMQPKHVEPDSSDAANELLIMLSKELSTDQQVILERMLSGQTQKEIAEALEVDERTIRRRVGRIRQQLSAMDEATSPSKLSVMDETMSPSQHLGLVTSSTTTLPRVSYRDFVLGKLIGSGGFGKVYRASMQSDGRIVAVKFLRKAFWRNTSARQTFMREINAASQISHPGIIRYLGYGESPHGGPYVISEWIDGQSIQNAADVTQPQFIGWLVQICEAIQAVHRAGLVHGDLTPSNILVDAQDQITITDFGFSQATAESASPFLGGTLGFAAPEQIDTAFGSISAKTDIYAIGGLVHWFLFGQPPNAGHRLEDALTQTISQHESTNVTSDTIPKALREILSTTLRKSPSERSMSLTLMLQRLRLTATEN